MRGHPPALTGGGLGCATEDAPIRVMVVDDHPMWRDGVARDLTEAGYEVVATAADGEQAIRVAARRGPTSSCSTCSCRTRPASR